MTCSGTAMAAELRRWNVSMVLPPQMSSSFIFFIDALERREEEFHTRDLRCIANVTDEHDIVIVVVFLAC